MLTAAGLPARFGDEAALEDFMTEPSATLTGDLASIDGDVMILGVGGKKGRRHQGLATRQ